MEMQLVKTSAFQRPDSRANVFGLEPANIVRRLAPPEALEEASPSGSMLDPVAMHRRWSVEIQD